MLMRMFVANEVARLGGWLDWVAITLPGTSPLSQRPAEEGLGPLQAGKVRDIAMHLDIQGKCEHFIRPSG